MNQRANPPYPLGQNQSQPAASNS
uniref:Uncharacterized protein n=1 Tax=Anguilla anguilla TaxID=7936 RepID=A0A0E9QXX0_ANGAN